MERAAADRLDPPLEAQVERLVEVVKRAMLILLNSWGSKIEPGDIDPLHDDSPIDLSPEQQVAFFRR